MADEEDEGDEKEEAEHVEEDADAIWIRQLTVERDFHDLQPPPIDLNIATMTVKKLNKQLVWCHYQIPPKKLKLTNTGKTVVLSANWHQDTPFLTCGPFLSRYVFSQVHFHWGCNDMDGSDHTVDGASLPMELHAVHFNSVYPNQEVAMRKPDGISILVYFLKLQSLESPAMKKIVKTLPLVQQAQSSTRVAPWPLTNLLRPFNSDYFVYRGSISSGNSIHSVLWLISRRPIGISVDQMTEFRNLKDKNFERLGRKPRGLLDRVNHNEIFHVNPSGSMHASLLPVLRDDPVAEENSTSTIEDCCKSEEASSAV